MDIFAEAEIKEICWEVPSDSFSEYNWRQFPYPHNVQVAQMRFSCSWCQTGVLINFFPAQAKGGSGSCGGVCHYIPVLSVYPAT